MVAAFLITASCKKIRQDDQYVCSRCMCDRLSESSMKIGRTCRLYRMECVDKTRELLLPTLWGNDVMYTV